jgi:DNA-binding transcriptional ArsR family regulator
MADLDLPLAQREETIPVLPEQIPVQMPDLPPRLIINTAAQYKALGDATRTRILGIIQQQPATARQIAERLRMPHGTVGHHLQSLEAAGLAQIVARRLVRGIVAKYYTRTARLFLYESPQEAGVEVPPIALTILTHLRDEVAEVLTERTDTDTAGGMRVGFPHARLSPERAQEYEQRLNALIDEFVEEPSAPDGLVYGLGFALFVAPAYVQVTPSIREESREP